MRNAGVCWFVSPNTDGFASCKSTLQYSSWGCKAHIFLWRAYKQKRWWHAWFSRHYIPSRCVGGRSLFHRTTLSLGQERDKVNGSGNILWHPSWTWRARKHLFQNQELWCYLPLGSWRVFASSIGTFLGLFQHGRAHYIFLDIWFELWRAHPERRLKHLFSIFGNYPPYIGIVSRVSRL